MTEPADGCALVLKDEVAESAGTGKGLTSACDPDMSLISETE